MSGKVWLWSLLGLGLLPPLAGLADVVAAEAAPSLAAWICSGEVTLPLARFCGWRRPVGRLGHGDGQRALVAVSF